MRTLHFLIHRRYWNTDKVAISCWIPLKGIAMQDATIVELYQIIIIAGALTFSAFFSGIEIAFLAADKLDIELEKGRKPLAGKILARLLKRPDRFISTILIGK